MLKNVARIIERLMNPKSWRRYELDCDFAASASALAHHHNSPGWALHEITNRGEFPAGVISASGADDGRVVVYFDSKITTLERVLEGFAKDGLFFQKR